MKNLMVILSAAAAVAASGQPTLEFSASTYPVGESAGAATVMVQREGDAGPAVSVDYATADFTATNGLKYMAVSGTLRFDAGETNKAIVVPILNEGFAEGTRGFRVTLSNPSSGASLGARTTTTVNIIDNDVGVEFVYGAYSVAKDAGAVVLWVVRGDDGELPVTADVATADVTALSGRDYTGLTNRLSFGGTERLEPISVPILNNSLQAANKTFRVTLTNPSGASLGGQKTAIVTVVDNEGGFQFESASYTVGEDAGVAPVRVLRGTDGTDTTTTVDYTAIDGNATNGLNYMVTNGTLSFAPGERAKLVPVTILNDGAREPTRSFQITLSNPSAGALLGSRASTTVFILDNDPGAGFEFPSYTSAWDQPGEIQVTVLRGNDWNLGPFGIDYATHDGTAMAGTDYQASSGTLEFQANETVKAISVPLLRSRPPAGTRNFTLTLSNPTGGMVLGRSSTTVTLSGAWVTIAPPVDSALAIGRAAGVNTLTWSGGGQLQQADQIIGPWQTLASASSPYTVQPSVPAAFYRVTNPRPVNVYVPSKYDGHTPIPLVILLHGYTGTGAGEEGYMRFQPLAESQGFLYCYPDGTFDNTHRRWWNAYFMNAQQASAYGSPYVDDRAYLRGLIQEVARHFALDRKRVFLIGHSNGAFMSHQFARDSADLVAAIASLAGSAWLPGFGPTPSGPVNVLEIHGTADSTVFYSDYTGSNPNTPMFPGAMHTIQIWAGFNGASNCVTDTAATLDLDTGLGNPDTVVTRYMDHPPGGAVELWTIIGAEHSPNLSSEFAPKVIDWLFAHPKP